MKKYAIYGDDDQQRLNEIFEEEDVIQELVDQANRKTMNDRKKEASKKKVLDTTVNNEKPGEIEDIEQGNPVDKKPKKEKKKESKPKEKDSKTNKKVAIIIVLILLIIVAGSTIFTLFGDQAADLYNKTFNKEDNPSEVIDMPINNGEQPIVDNPYKFDDIVRVSQEMNTYLQEYYGSVQEIIEVSKTDSPSELISTLRQKVEEDFNRFQSFEPYYGTYEGGATYYKSLLDRFDNIRGLLVSIENVSDNDMMYTLIKNTIDVENQLIVKGKNELINFFEANNIDYKDKDTSVVFEVK